MKIETTVRCPIHDSFRVRQVAGLMDVPIEQRAEQTWSVDVPTLEEPWQIGAIVGPSGSGKSTIARAAFGDRLFAGGLRSRMVVCSASTWSKFSSGSLAVGPV
jgi:ABC-type glutathione transport system ATPase component